MIRSAPSRPPIPTLFANRDLEKYTRVVWQTLRVNTNWKFASDNFNEAYHIPSVHPQFEPMIDDHYSTTLFEMYPNGHNRMVDLLLGSVSAKCVEHSGCPVLVVHDTEPPSG